jgi:hypothetical protein
MGPWTEQLGESLHALRSLAAGLDALSGESLSAWPVSFVRQPNSGNGLMVRNI